MNDNKKSEKIIYNEKNLPALSAYLANKLGSVEEPLLRGFSKKPEVLYLGYANRIFDKIKEEIKNKGEITQKEVDEIIFDDKQEEFIEHSTDMANSF